MNNGAQANMYAMHILFNDDSRQVLRFLPTAVATHWLYNLVQHFPTAVQAVLVKE
jgi:hypothetical protein